MFPVITTLAAIMPILQIMLILLGICALILLIKALQIYIRKNS